MSTPTSAPVSFLDVLADQIRAMTDEGNAIARKVADSAERSSNKQVHELIKASEDETVAKWREFEARALAKIESERAKVVDYIRANLMPEAGESLTEEQISTLHEKFKGIRTNVSAAVKFSELQPGYTPEWAATLPKLLTFKGNARKATTGGSNIRRPRLAAATLEGVEFKGEKKNTKGEVVPSVSFTLLAAEIQKRERAAGNSDAKLSAADLLNAADATDANWQNGTGVEFVYAGKDHNYTVTVIPSDKE